ncbi:ArsR/SmtB family transcription factor [Streptomyces ovatisporus]|uniref:ArsR/SmtB family transcription factor n=1 Tax=Streptomyces ovatisporus TaxID=1128682 RepID=A0ABV9A343_9ACTN
MRDVVYVESAEQAEAILKPARAAVLRELTEPRTCSEVAERLGQTPQRVYYHVKQLEAAGVVERVAERQVRNLVEAAYQAVARKFWMSPGMIGLPSTDPDDENLARLLDLAEQIQRDVAQLRPREDPLPSIGVHGEVRVKPEHREAFLRDVQAMLQQLFTRYGGAEGEGFTLALACYPDTTTPALKDGHRE